MKNEMKNVFYTCPYCKEEYTDPVDLAHCILSCEEKKKVEEEKQKQEKLAAEKDARYKEIQAAEEKLIELKKAYIEDYGSYYTQRSFNDKDAVDIFRYFF